MDTEFAGVHTDMNAGFAAVDRRFTVVGQRIDQLDAKLGEHRRTNDGFETIRRVVGGMSRTQSDHEDRIKALEGE